MPDDLRDLLLERLLDQNERMLAANLKAMDALVAVVTPQPVPPRGESGDPWGFGDRGEPRVDAWGDPEVPFEDLVARPPLGPGSREEEPE